MTQRIEKAFIVELDNLLVKYIQDEYFDRKPNMNLAIIAKLKKLDKRQRSSVVNRQLNWEVKSMHKKDFTFLSIACYRNDVTLVEFLTKQCYARTEEIVSMCEYEHWDNITFYSEPCQFDRFTYLPVYNVMATVLWHACRGASLQVIETLVKCGANINSVAEKFFNSTPLMVACAKNRLNVVKFLLQNGADINIKNKNQETCLFFAVRHNDKCIDILEILFENGANINDKNANGDTVLEMCVTHSNTAVLEYLLKKNVKGFDNQAVENTLMRLAVTDDFMKFKTVYDLKNISDLTRINALEALAVSSITKRENPSYSFMFFDLSIDMRARASINKKSIRIQPYFKNEYITLKELNSLSDDLCELIMQTMYVRERILEAYPLHFNVFTQFCLLKMLRICGINYRNSFDNFNKINILFLSTLGFQVTYCKPCDNTIFNNLTDFVFYLMSVPTHGTQFAETVSTSLMNAFKYCFHELLRATKLRKFVANAFRPFVNFDSLINALSDQVVYHTLFTHSSQTESKCNFNIDSKYELEYLSKNIPLIVKLSVCILSFIVSNCMYSLTQLQQNELKILTKKLVFFTSHLNDGLNKVLSLATRTNIIQDFFVEKSFSNIENLINSNVNYKLVEYLLVHGGADPDTYLDNYYKYDHDDIYGMNPVDIKSSNTFLNSRIFIDSHFNDIHTANLFIKLFLEKGAHIDYVNNEGKTLIEMYSLKFKGKNLNTYLKTSHHVSLKCLASRAILRHNIKYNHLNLPKDLASFIERH